MPNNITNILTFTGDRKDIEKMLSEIQQDSNYGTLDFNKIIPMPESLNIEAGSMESTAIRAYLHAVSPITLDYGYPKITESDYSEKLYNALKCCPRLASEQEIKITPELVKQGEQYISNIENYGYMSWYDRRVNNWGTKWNSYNGNLSGKNQIEFLTAWSRPENIIQKLSEMYPNIEIEHLWADEDFGYNCGKAVYCGGDEIKSFQPKGGSDEAIEFASSILGYEMEDEENLIDEPEM